MRKFLAGLLGMVLCVQTVYGIPVRSADVFEPGERPKAMQDVIWQEDPEQTNGDNSGNLTGLELSAESAVIMEASSGQILFEKNADEKKPPASVTKVMTLLLIFDALADGTITPDTEVTTSEYAASMGGSQVFLEAGEKQTVDTMIKCIAVASANDACVAMAEKIAGSEPAFVEKMNQRSAGLGMTNTHFVNCNGLDTEGHLTTARDIALMSRELITKYPQIENYSTIWMENITHTTAKGSSEFGLSNTNKLIRQYEYATGLKTGSTSGAKFCLSATARKDGVNMIAVVMAEPDSKTRIKDAIAMLNYGFGKCSIYQDEKALEKIVYAEVKHGMQEKAKGETLEGFRYVDTSGSDLSAVKKEVRIQKQTAPVKKGDQIGEVIYRLNEKTIGSVPVYATEGVGELTFGGAFLKILEEMMV